GDAIDDIRARAEESQVIRQAAARRVLHQVMCGNARIALPETQQPQQQTRWRREIKCPAPAEVSTDQAADDIAQRTADWNGGAKNRHDPAAYFDGEKIGQDCRCSRAVTAFANSNANESRKENSERRRQTGAAAGHAPKA